MKLHYSLERRRYEFEALDDEPTDADVDAYMAEDYITQAERDKAAKSGEAMPDGSYPIRNGGELDKAIKAVGRGNADHDAIRKHIIKRAKALGQSNKIPDNWKSDGSLKAAAAEDVDELTAAIDPTQLEQAWHANIFVEGLRTTDGRAADVGAGVWRDLPIALQWVRKYEGGHLGAEVVGSITSIERVEQDGFTLLYAEGVWDLGGVKGDGVGADPENPTHGAECARQVGLQGGTRFVSADIEPIEVDVVSARSGEVIDNLWDAFQDGDDEWYEVMTNYRIGKATVVSLPAFPQCVIAPLSVALPVVEPLGAIEPEPLPSPMLVASISIRESAPPAAWFRQPDLRMPTPLTVTDEGRVYGHLADWRTPHTGYGGQRIYAPHNSSGYRYFLTGEIETEDGETIPVGQLTMGCGHAGMSDTWSTARAHYDGGPGAIQAADVMVGDDGHGIWVAGALRSGLSEAQVREFRALAPSGDWRKIGGRLELVASVQVPVPGFPVPRSSMPALAASGANVISIDGRDRSHYKANDSSEMELVSLVAAGRVVHDPIGDMFASLVRRISALESVVAANGLNEAAIDALEASLAL